MVNAGVRFVDMDFTGGYASIENIFQGSGHQLLKYIGRHITQVVDHVAVVFQSADQFQHFAAGTQDVGPIVQDTLHLKLTSYLPCFCQHLLVALKPGQQTGIQLCPLLTAKGQLIHQILGLSVAQTVDQVGLGIKVQYDSTQIENNAFIHKIFLKILYHGLFSQYNTSAGESTSFFCVS